MNTCVWVLLDVPYWGASNEYPIMKTCLIKYMYTEKFTTKKKKKINKIF